MAFVMLGFSSPAVSGCLPLSTDSDPAAQTSMQAGGCLPQALKEVDQLPGHYKLGCALACTSAAPSSFFCKPLAAFCDRF